MSRIPIALRAVIFGLMAPGSVTVLGPYLLLRNGSDGSFHIGAVRFAGLVPTALGVVVLGWCFLDFVRSGRGTPAPWDAPTALVSRGLYRFVRNPMYVGVLLVLLGETLVFERWWLLGYAATVWLMFHLFVTVYEEPELTRRFGESYAAYRGTVPRWIPRPPAGSG